MNRILSAVVMACLTIVVITGCRGAGQVYNVKEAPVATATGKELTMEQVQKAIVEAGLSLRWIMTPDKPGHILGTQNARSHTAVVDIDYTTKSYSITYKDSVNLKYNADKQTIHEAYIGWVRNLDNAIKGRLMAASAP
ncbi:hypothetical protein [Nitrospira lenta]|uniref:Putative lipoprotein n=1 Tax=Nitrospira lenta TaxID=1436998 RepID=A0A330L4N4_9BACT|nr:hypothetical protein [Nitrospira lenta]SPP64788.1 putative lipoprotein [Nitrospira lenta]